MATNTIRVDDSIKNQASSIAADLGLTYNAIINVFLREFIRHRGFPFQVQLPKEENNVFSMSTEEITRSVKEAVQYRSDVAVMPYTTIMDDATGIIYKVYADGHKEEL